MEIRSKVATVAPGARRSGRRMKSKFERELGSARSPSLWVNDLNASRQITSRITFLFHEGL